MYKLVELFPVVVGRDEAGEAAASQRMDKGFPAAG